MEGSTQNFEILSRLDSPAIIHNIFHSVLCFCYRNIVCVFLFVAEVLKRAMMSLHLLNHSTIVTKSFVRRFITAFKCLQWSLRHAVSVSRCVSIRLLLGRYWCMTSLPIETSCSDYSWLYMRRPMKRGDGNCYEHKSYRKIIHLIHFWAVKATRRQHAKRGSEKVRKVEMISFQVGRSSTRMETRYLLRVATKKRT